MTYEVKLSVRELVEYVYASGSIDNRFRTASTLTDGTKAHQKIQKEYDAIDQKEVYLKMEWPFNDLNFVIEGRCDGLLLSQEVVTIDEIKSTAKELVDMTEDSYPVHWAQAKVYAFMYAKDHHIEKLNVQLTYVQVKTDEKKQFIQQVTLQELEKEVEGYIQNYVPFAEVKQKHKKLRNETISDLAFPFSQYRKGQRKLAGAVYKSIDENKTLFANAPTGIGKTISTLFPTIKSIGEEKVERFFYLTAKTITRTAAEEALNLMEEKGLVLQTVTITAKDKVCFKDETRCHKDYCEFADGYYDRINDAILDILNNETQMSRTVIETYAQKHRVCPFEFSLDLAYQSDGVVCDYNYVFDPRVSLKRQRDEQKKRTVLLIDEAHNLVERAREMFSAPLYKKDFLKLQQDYKGKHEALYQSAKAINTYFIDMKKQCGADKRLVIKELQEEFITLLDTFTFNAEKELLNHSDGKDQQELLNAYFLAQASIRVAKLYADSHLTYIEVTHNEVVIKLFCIDPSLLLKQMSKGYKSKIFFSATLAPFDYFRSMLGATSEDYSIAIPSPFNKEQLKVIIQPLSTRFRDREKTKGQLTELIKQLVEERPGNYLVFFPSYQYMNAVYDELNEEVKKKVALQTSYMTENDREAYLGQFQENNSETLVGFAVLGGIFSEGVDLKGDRLTGVIVVGVGLPQLSLERDVIKDFYNRLRRNGYDYAYVYPGMNKVLQAGGRLIRSEKDHGLLILVDDRFLQKKYQNMLPEEWK